ncbi:MAG TPA: hypothetical protein PLZ15_09810 [Melioribacteraceae bacterium]|nr:hypothetical protein [Melioribacteraceae bacterium]
MNTRDYIRSRREYFLNNISEFRDSNGLLVHFIPSCDIKGIIDFENNEIQEKLMHRLRYYLTGSTKSVKDNLFIINLKNKHNIICSNNGQIELFQAGISKVNQLDTTLKTIRIEDIYLKARRFSEIVELIKTDYSIECDIEMSFSLIGVHGSYLISFDSRKINPDPLLTDIVMLPSLTIPKNEITNLMIVLKKHFMEGNILLTEDL